MNRPIYENEEMHPFADNQIGAFPDDCESAEMQAIIGTFLDDCVSTVEVIRCMLDKGVEHIDGEGVTLKEEVFDRCFPGRDWQEYPIDGEPGWTFTVKTVLYRGFVFDAIKREKELGNE